MLRCPGGFGAICLGFGLRMRKVSGKLGGTQGASIDGLETNMTNDKNTKQLSRVVYIRDCERRPIGCVAYEVKDDVLTLAWSAGHSRLAPNPKLLRKVAEGRLKQRRERSCTGNWMSFEVREPLSVAHIQVEVLWTIGEWGEPLPMRVSAAAMEMASVLEERIAVAQARSASREPVTVRPAE